MIDMSRSDAWLDTMVGGQLAFLRDKVMLPRDEFFRVLAALNSLGFSRAHLMDWAATQKAKQYIMTMPMEYLSPMTHPQSVIENMGTRYATPEYHRKYAMHLCNTCYKLHLNYFTCDEADARSA